MPSTSKSQQRLMGVAYAVKNGDMQLSDVDSNYRDAVKDLVDGMTLKQLKDFASTKHDNLPEKAKEDVEENMAAVAPPMLGGMGAVVLPNAGALGSGDAPAGQGDAEEEYKKKKRKAKVLSMEEFISEQEKQIKPFDPSKELKDEQLGEEGYESGSSVLPDQEAIQKEMARRKVSGIVSMKFESFINR